MFAGKLTIQFFTHCEIFLTWRTIQVEDYTLPVAIGELVMTVVVYQSPRRLLVQWGPLPKKNGTRHWPKAYPRRPFAEILNKRLSHLPIRFSQSKYGERRLEIGEEKSCSQTIIIIKSLLNSFNKWNCCLAAIHLFAGVWKCITVLKLRENRLRCTTFDGFARKSLASWFLCCCKNLWLIACY